MKKMRCPMCDKEFKDKLQFCPYCGVNAQYLMQHGAEDDTIKDLEEKRSECIKSIEKLEKKIPPKKKVFKEAFFDTVPENLYWMLYFILGHLLFVVTVGCLLSGVDMPWWMLILALAFAWAPPLIVFFSRMLKRENEKANVWVAKEKLREIDEQLEMLSESEKIQ